MKAGRSFSVSLGDVHQRVSRRPGLALPCRTFAPVRPSMRAECYHKDSSLSQPNLWLKEQMQPDFPTGFPTAESAAGVLRQTVFSAALAISQRPRRLCCNSRDGFCLSSSRGLYNLCVCLRAGLQGLPAREGHLHHHIGHRFGVAAGPEASFWPSVVTPPCSSTENGQRCLLPLN